MRGSALEDSEVVSLGSEEYSEPPVEELRRCVSRCRLRRFDRARHISGVLPPLALVLLFTQLIDLLVFLGLPPRDGQVLAVRPSQAQTLCVTLRPPPLYSETVWTGELWSNRVFLILEN